MACGFWNVAGWSNAKDSDNFKSRENFLNTVNFDILAVAETHLVRDKELTVSGYKWFGQNRKTLHKKALRVKNEMLRNFNVSTGFII